MREGGKDRQRETKKRVGQGFGREDDKAEEGKERRGRGRDGEIGKQIYAETGARARGTG